MSEILYEADNLTISGSLKGSAILNSDAKQFFLELLINIHINGKLRIFPISFDLIDLNNPTDGREKQSLPGNVGAGSISLDLRDYSPWYMFISMLYNIGYMRDIFKDDIDAPNSNMIQGWLSKVLDRYKDN